MPRGLIWATAEDLANNRGRVLSLYRQILRSLNSPKLKLSFAARLSKKAEVRAMFWVGSEERSLHNINDLIDSAEYSLSFLKKGYGFIEFLSHAAPKRVLHTYNGTPMPNTEQSFRLNWASFSVGERKPDSGPDYSIFVGDLAPDVIDYLL